MAEEHMVSVRTHKEQDKVIADKRVFLKRAAAALGVVVAAGLTGTAISKSAEKVSKVNARVRYAEDDLRQQQLMTGKKLIIMTQEEKQQMLDRILRNHRTVS
jgi:ClpP class serine protease